MANLKIKIVEINGDRKGGDLSLRELNIILEQFITREVKTITLGKWSIKKSDIISMDVFEDKFHRIAEYKEVKNYQELPEYIEPQAHIGE